MAKKRNEAKKKNYWAKTKKTAAEMVQKRNREMSPAERQRRRVQGVSRQIDASYPKSKRR